MKSLKWSWTFTLGLLAHDEAFALEHIDYDYVAFEALERAHPIAKRATPRKKDLKPIVLGVLCGIMVCLIIAVLCLHALRRRSTRHALEDGPAMTQLSGRQWFSRFGRFQRYPHPSQEKGKHSVSDKISALPELAYNDKSFPRYIKGGHETTKSLSPAAFPLPPSPAHIVTSINGSPLVVSFPSPLSGRRTPESLRLVSRSDRRLVQVTAQQPRDSSSRSIRRNHHTSLSAGDRIKKQLPLRNPFRAFQSAKILPSVPTAVSPPLQLSNPVDILASRKKERLFDTKGTNNGNDSRFREVLVDVELEPREGMAETGRRSLDHGAAPPF